MDAEGNGRMKLISERTLRRIDRSVETGKIIPFLALSTLVIAGVAGVVAKLLAPNAFGSLGDALWWSAQTVTTVGYGDVVPDTAGGRLVGVFVMVFGVASVALITALVTSSFITYQERRAGGELDRHRQLVEALERIDGRLTEIEHQLS